MPPPSPRTLIPLLPRPRRVAPEAASRSPRRVPDTKGGGGIPPRGGWPPRLVPSGSDLERGECDASSTEKWNRGDGGTGRDGDDDTREEEYGGDDDGDDDDEKKNKKK
mmetsp:Transcript_3766/g.7470  ORF Transcript_3766/g.7470 Transcript_3766/m.7470 type:complete len:108 (+) Transcript_3766:61-384(+)